jgi:CRISPR/Cas system-associated exonuclease Cas4 (RecB family)
MQASDMEQKRNTNLVKIIAKYLLILGHINYNRIEYNKEVNDVKRKIIYEKKTYHLYKLISNTLYKDTYDDINDTFKTSTLDLIIEDGKYNKYKNLTYIYNYLETRYVNISSNNNNYLENIISSINNKLNDDNMKFNNENKTAQYIFRDNIDNIRYPDAYEDEQEILNIANNVSTFDFGSTYIFNMLLLILYYYLIVKKT